MGKYSLMGIALVIVGVLLIVFGAGTAIGGFNKMDASERWEEQNTEMECSDDYEISIEGDSVEQTGECNSVTRGTNPYNGGKTDVLFGSFLVMIGGVAAYIGNQN
jgi:hypothetical protein